MITESRWQHILGVARKAKEIAEIMRPNDTKFAEDMFLLGMLHDFGYEFCELGPDHGPIGGEILRRSGYKYWREVAEHSIPEAFSFSDEIFIINCADMIVGPNGEKMTMEERIADIVKRYGKDSPGVEKAKKMAELLQKDERYRCIEN